MQQLAATFLLLGCLVFLMPVSAVEKRSNAVPVVAKFGGECEGVAFNSSPQLKKLIQRTKQRIGSPCDWPFCDGAFIYNLNEDRKKEFFVRLSCGATGNCTWGIFSDNPARVRGVFTAWFFYIHKRASAWSTITTYTREGGDQGVIATLANRRGRYTQTSERTEKGDYENPQPFLKRLGIPKCD